MTTAAKPRRPRITRRILDTLSTALDELSGGIMGDETRPDRAEILRRVEAAETWIRGMKDCIKPAR